MKKYDFTAAVIGTGYIGIQHLEALKELVSEVIVCNADAEKGMAVADRTFDHAHFFRRDGRDLRV